MFYQAEKTGEIVEVVLDYDYVEDRNESHDIPPIFPGLPDLSSDSP